MDKNHSRAPPSFLFAVGMTVLAASLSSSSRIRGSHSLRFGTTPFRMPNCGASCRRRSRGSALLSPLPFSLRMGLYDSPLPPRPSPRKNNPNKSTRNNFRANDENDDDDDEFEDEVPLLLTERLFSFDQSGKEIRGLLPPLRRRLDSGVACYFEATDRLVLNLVEKTACHPDDAGWALEACQGDITQAWTSISVARRLALNRDQQIANEAQDAEYDPDDYEMEVLEEYQQRKTKLNAELKKRNRDEYLRLSEPDAPWLPTKNPRPVEDEPWFTG